MSRLRRLTYQELDAIPYVDENGRIIPNKIYERVEQDDTNKFIPPHAVVLELGGRYGTVSAVINHKLDDPTQHVVVEPDPTVQVALRTNRESHDCHYSIVYGIISKKKMYLNNMGYGTHCLETPSNFPVNNYSLEEVSSMYPTKPFTHLVADCEGGFVDFLEDYPDLVKSMEGVYFETDGKWTTPVNYTFLLQKLGDWGFYQKKIAGAHQYWEKNPRILQTNLTLEELDAIPYKDEKGTIIQSKYVEREEQQDAELLIPPHAVVLELGGRYGLAAAVVNNRLDNPVQHIVVEPDPTVQEALKANRDSHFCYYTIFEGVVSRQPMYFNQYGYCSFCSPVPNDTPVQTLTIEELQELYRIGPFTHLVADCEGGLLDFFEENKEFLATLEGIYFEGDTRNGMQTDYKPLKLFLQEKGFLQEKSGFREYWKREKLGSASA
jgi:hypothetical protein